MERCKAAPKPVPDLFLAAAAGFGVDPAATIAFEDSRNGLLAALAAGCPCLVVPNRITAHLDFTGARAVLGSLEEVDLRGIG